MCAQGLVNRRVWRGCSQKRQPGDLFAAFLKQSPLERGPQARMKQGVTLEKDINNGPDAELPAADIAHLMQNARAAAGFLKALSHEGRLMILCQLASGEKSVTELEDLLSARQAAVSQQLTRLRQEGLVTPRREGKAIYYSLADERARRVMEVVYDLFCKEQTPEA